MGRHRARRWVGRALAALGLGVVALLALGYRGDRPAAEVEARLAQAPSKFLTVGGLRTHYRDRGQGAPIILLHGSNASLHTWEGWAAELAKSWRVITLDLPGHGLTGPDPQERYSLAAMAGFVADFARELGLARYVLGGNSMGGGVSWHHALRHPGQVDRLILVDAFGLPSTEGRPLGFRLYASPVTGPLVRWLTPRFMIARSLRETHGDPRRVTERTVDLYEDILLREGNREATRRRFATVRLDGLHERLGELRMPTLILWGGRDRWILPRYGRQFQQRIPGSRLVVLEGLGHVPMEEDPARSVAVVRDFLTAARPPGPLER